MTPRLSNPWERAGITAGQGPSGGTQSASMGTEEIHVHPAHMGNISR